jgi:hypothetical protein
LPLQNISPVNPYSMPPSKKSKEIKLKISIYTFSPPLFFNFLFSTKKDLPLEAFAPREGKLELLNSKTEFES